MSTYYSFYCEACKKDGGFFSRQAWGWGNFDIVDSFKFLAHHVSTCGESEIKVLSEQDERWHGGKEEDRRKFLEETADIFPSSNDWIFMEKVGRDFKAQWVASELAKVPEGKEKNDGR